MKHNITIYKNNYDEERINVISLPNNDLFYNFFNSRGLINTGRETNLITIYVLIKKLSDHIETLQVKNNKEAIGRIRPFLEGLKYVVANNLKKDDILEIIVE